MNNSQRKEEHMLTVIMIIGAVALRLIPHMPNFAPITALGLFGGMYVNKKFAFIAPLVAMVISDYLLLYISPFEMKYDFSHIYPITALFHSTTPYVWGSFIISSLIGMWLRSRKTPVTVVAGTFFASLQFFLITNFGVWVAGTYSRTISGLLESYVMGLPFFQWTFLGDLFFTGIFVLGYEVAVRLAKRNTAKNLAM